MDLPTWTRGAVVPVVSSHSANAPLFTSPFVHLALWPWDPLQDYLTAFLVFVLLVLGAGTGGGTRVIFYLVVLCEALPSLSLPPSPCVSLSPSLSLSLPPSLPFPLPPLSLPPSLSLSLSHSLSLSVSLSSLPPPLSPLSFSSSFQFSSKLL